MSGVSGSTPKPSRCQRLTRRVTRFTRRLSPRTSSPPLAISTTTSVSLSSEHQEPATNAPQLASHISLGGSQPGSLPVDPSNSLSRDLLARALEQLTEPNRQTLEAYILPTTFDASIAFEQALQAARDKEQQCLDKRWKVILAGREIILREIAANVVRWFDRFKTVGDVVANVDPVHFGLPWAGLRLLLEVTVTDVRQMQALLKGCETTLYIGNRLREYSRFLHHLPPNAARTNFEVAFVKLYTHLLQFLARAIETYQQSTSRRIITALWKENDVVQFEQACHQLGVDLDIEARICERATTHSTEQTTTSRYQELQTGLRNLEQLHTLHAPVGRIETKLDLGKMPYVANALYNAYEQVHTACHPATRVDLLRHVHSWALDEQSKKIFWLNGMAGTGKSTISYTMARWLENSAPQNVATLGASFFFKRGEGDRGTAKRFFPTLIRQLADRISGLGSLVAEALDSDTMISDKALAEQFDKLFYQPLQTFNPSGHLPLLVIVVDALDECDSLTDIDVILRLWPRLSKLTTVSLKLFLTSRPELRIREGFDKIAATLHLDLALQDDDIPKATINQDLYTFLRDRLLDVREKNDSRYSNDDTYSDAELGSDWPGDKIVQTLAARADPLFIVAATTIRFLDEAVDLPGTNPKERLRELLSHAGAGWSSIAETYIPVLSALGANTQMASARNALYESFRLIVGSIVNLAEPVSVKTLATLLAHNPYDIARLLRFLHSVLHVPDNQNDPVRPLHLSFSEFLMSEEIQDHPFAVNGRNTHAVLFQSCVRFLSGQNGLRENICHLNHPGILRNDVEEKTINQYMSNSLRYACRYWIYHLMHARFLLSDDDEVHVFLKKHFLHWLEALSLMGRLSDAIEGLDTLQMQISMNEEATFQVTSFLEDARRFVLSFRHISERAPLQLYSAATIFAPQNSIIRNLCGHQPAWIPQTPIVPLTWSLDLQKLEGHIERVNAVSFAHDRPLLASGSSDRTIRLWNAKTGQELQKLQPEGYAGRVTAVNFSPDGSILVSASDDISVRLWDVNTGQQIRKFEGHTEFITAVEFSPSNPPLILATASEDLTVRLWDVQTGEELWSLREERSSVLGISFSPDGLQLAMITREDIVKLWNVRTRQEVWKPIYYYSTINAVSFSPGGSYLALALEDTTIRLLDKVSGLESHVLRGHTKGVLALSFRFDGLMLASSSSDHTVKLWDIQTKEEAQTLKGHTSSVEGLSFSADGLLLASASTDTTVIMWAAQTGREIQELEGHTGLIRRIRFSPDGLLLASASVDRMVILWNVQTGRPIRKFEGHTDVVFTICFSPGGKLLASASADFTIRLWDIQTGREVQVLKGHTTEVQVIAFSPDGTLLVSASSLFHPTLVLWDLQTGQQLSNFGNCEMLLSTLSFSPDGSLLASASMPAHPRIILWRIPSGQEVQRLEELDGSVAAIGLSSDGLHLASAMWGNVVHLWDLAKGQILRTFENIPHVSHIEFSFDNNLLQTNMGPIDLAACLPPNGDAQPTRQGDTTSESDMSNRVQVFGRGDWIQVDGQNALWLPQDYRRHTTDIRDNVVAIGRACGQVCFIRLAPSMMAQVTYDKLHDASVT